MKVLCSSVSLLILLVQQQHHTALVQAQNVRPNPGNFLFDPNTTETGTCNIPPYQDSTKSFQPEASMCQAPDPTLTIQDARALAAEYAPYLYFHPLEKYTLTNVDDAFADPTAGKVYYNGDKLSVFDDQLNLTSMLRSTRDDLLGLNAQKYFVTHNDTIPDLYTHDYFDPPAYLKGSGYDAQGLSNAPIYYRVFDSGNGTWTFDYWFYYAFNGHSNMGVLSSTNGTLTYTPFQMRPFGQHESDFEAMSVQVCQSRTTSQPLAVSYRQHGWNQIANCLEGHCSFYKDTVHPVGFAALNSHATYAVPTRNMIYANVEIPFFVNLQGVVIVDRCEFRDADGNYKQFLPNATNVVRLNEIDEIELGVTPEEFYWQAWGGSFGDITKPTIPLSDPYCLATDQLSFVECPSEEEDPIFTLVMQFFGVYPVNETKTLIDAAAVEFSAAVKAFFSETGSSPNGPQVKYYYDAWTSSSSAPLWDMIPSNTTQEDFCTRLLVIPDTGRTDVSSSSVPLMTNIIWMLAVAVLMPLLTIVWYIWPIVRGYAFVSAIRFDDNGEMMKPDWGTWWKVHRPALMFTTFYITAIAGLILFGRGYDRLFKVMDDLVGGGNIWDFITRLVFALGIIVIFLDTCLLILIWIPTSSLWWLLMMKYYDLTGDDANMKKMRWFVKDFMVIHVAFVVSFGLLFLSLMISTVAMIVGVAVVGFSTGFNELCNQTVGSLDGYCLDLGFIGIEEIQCGADFQEFCSEWGRAARVNTLWGAFVFTASQFYFIAAAGELYFAQVSLYPALQTLPSREEHQASLKKISMSIDSCLTLEQDPVQQEEAVETNGGGEGSQSNGLKTCVEVIN